MKTVEEIRAMILAVLPDAQVGIVTNPSVSGEHSLLLGAETALAVAGFLRDHKELELDYLSNVTGVDWPEREITEKVKVTKTVDGVEQQVEETVKRTEPGYLEVVYHLYSMELKHGPVILRMRTGNRTDQVELPSMVNIWRSADFQEREVFDLYGVVFRGHHDLRRLLMWDGFKDHPMRRDYVEPDDYEYEPTAPDQVLARAEAHRAALAEAAQKGASA